MSKEEILRLHHQGKIAISNKIPINNAKDLAKVYTPGVAEVVKEIAKFPDKKNEYTILGNTVGMFCDGTAVLGLGNVGPIASMPVMEGKAMIYKAFADINAYPLLLNTTDVNKIVDTIVNLSISFSLIHIEDIAAPACFEVCDKLEKILDIPVFHDDQFGTAIIVLAGIINSLKVYPKDIKTAKIVINGAGAAGIAIARLLFEYGFRNIVLCDSKGIVSEKRKDLNKYKINILNLIDYSREMGDLTQATKNADVFIGVSKAGLLTRKMVLDMNKKPIIFALANPIPEILPSEIADLECIIATGRSDFPNQVNNAVGYPGFVKAVLQAGIKKIEFKHMISAANAIANTVDDVSESQIIPSAFNKEVVPNVVNSLKGN